MFSEQGPQIMFSKQWLHAEKSYGKKQNIGLKAAPFASSLGGREEHTIRRCGGNIK